LSDPLITDRTPDAYSGVTNEALQSLQNALRKSPVDMLRARALARRGHHSIAGA
jgi:hypothetical protein